MSQAVEFSRFTVVVADCAKAPSAVLKEMTLEEDAFLLRWERDLQ